MKQRHHHALGASAAVPLCRLPQAQSWLWLVRPDALEAATALGLLLLHHLPVLVVVLGPEVSRHG